MTDDKLGQIACTCKCSPEEHGPNGCKTWFGDNNTGFRCNCDWRRVQLISGCAFEPVRFTSNTPLRSTHADRLALDCGRQIIEMLQQKEADGAGIRGLSFGWSHEEVRQEIAQIILKNGFEKL